MAVKRVKPAVTAVLLATVMGLFGTVEVHAQAGGCKDVVLDKALTPSLQLYKDDNSEAEALTGKTGDNALADLTVVDCNQDYFKVMYKNQPRWVLRRKVKIKTDVTLKMCNQAQTATSNDNSATGRNCIMPAGTQ